MLQHVSLEVPPALVRDCVAFWKLLGFDEVLPPPLLRDRFTWVERDGDQVHLIALDTPSVAREGHAAIVAGDYAADLARLRDAGFELRDGLNAWDAPRTFVRDPAGHLIEVMSAPPPAGAWAS